MTLKPELIRGNELTLDMFFTALTTQVPLTANITVDGVTYDQQTLAKKVEEERRPFKALRSLKTEVKAVRAEMKLRKATLKRFIHALHTGISAYLGEDSPEIVKFGFKEDKKRRSLTSEERLARAEKAKRTRQARHTMGPRQKEGIHGTETPPKTTS